MSPQSLNALLIALLFVGTSCSGPRASEYLIRVDAGEHDRYQTVVTVPVPDDLGPGVYRLRDTSGESLWLQVEDTRTGLFVVPELAAGTSIEYRVEAADAPSDGIDLVEQGGRYELRSGTRPVLTYISSMGPLPRPEIPNRFARGGYLHPVLTPSGVAVTDDYPPNHLHHHGIWAAWTRTRFQGRTPDFWNMGDSTGTVEPVAVERTWEGPVAGGLQAYHRYIDFSAPDPITALDERWTVTVYHLPEGDAAYHVFDLVLKQQLATDSTLYLPEYLYGGVGFRGRRNWNGADNTFFLTSEGKTRVEGHATRARWCHIGGEGDEGLVGIAILNHPENFRAPQPMRIHPTEPFFNWAPTQAGDFAIEPGDEFTARYRFVVYDGEPDAREIDRLWQDFAQPPTVTFERSDSADV